MKKLACLLLVALVSLSMTVVAQSFDGGAYGGAVIEPIGIADLAEQPNGQLVIVSGTFTLQKLPGLLELSEGEDADKVAVDVIVPPYAWVNLEVDDATPVLVYGTVVKSGQAIKVVADRIGLPPEEAETEAEAAE
ncbi:MAG: hypothetical protein LBR23_08105 [Spirochaetaceae bacterium]|nr:hypothetical protein [Spirochaetaceae bacterium]